MYINNYPSNQRKNEKSDSGDKTAKKPDTANEKSAVQREIIMQEADNRRMVNEKVKIDFEVKKLKQDETELRINLRDRQLRLSRLEQEIKTSEDNLSRLRRKLNLL